MLPSFISNLFWNSEPLKEEEKELEEDAEGTKAVAEETKAVAEESGDWLIISCKGVSSESSSSRINSDADSVCSDASWVITPVSRFRDSGQQGSEVTHIHSMEDLLIEHPTMSVYRTMEDTDAGNLNEVEGQALGTVVEEDQNQQQIVMQQNNRQQRQQVAQHMHPRGLVGSHHAAAMVQCPTTLSKSLKMTRKALRKHNQNYLAKSKPHKVQRVPIRAGRRKC